MNLRLAAARFSDNTLGVLYPSTCPGCDDPLPPDRDRMPICEACGPKLQRIEAPYCDVCGQTYDGALSRGFQCSNCRSRDLAFDFAVGGYQARGLARELMHRYKYERHIHLVALLGRMAEAALADPRIAARNWLLVPVPLHWRRFQERGFNQAAELCRVLRRRHPDRFTVSRILRRVRHTQRQAGLPREDRLVNLRAAFSLSRRKSALRKLRKKPVLLVDDVLTTGATASECARVLRARADVSDVGVLTALRG